MSLEVKDGGGAADAGQVRSVDISGPRPPVPGKDEEDVNYKDTCRCSSLERCRQRDGDADGVEATSGGGCEQQKVHGTFAGAACLRWAENLHHLLNDSDGVNLFKRYLKQECGDDCLNFWFACNGLKKRRPEAETHQLIKLIYRKYLKSCNVIGISAGARQTIADRIRSSPDPHVFDEAQREVENLINETTYQTFLRSDIYLQHLQAVQCVGSGEAESPKNSGETSRSSSNGRPEVGHLATVHEDSELCLAYSSTAVTPHPVDGVSTLTLTSKHLMATQRHRAYIEPRRPENIAGVYLQGSCGTKVPNPYHAIYASFAPVSAQDSELQSLSSDAHTDDTVTLTDSSVDGSSAFVMNRKTMKRQNTAISRSISQNKDNLPNDFIPRTQRVPRDQIWPNEPDQFAAVLIKKLEEEKQKREVQERMGEKLEMIEDGRSNFAKPFSEEPAPRQGPILKQAFMAMADNIDFPCDWAQSILDEHVSRVWKDSPHQTPPRPRSPHAQSSAAPAPAPVVPVSQRPHHRSHHHKDKDPSKEAPSQGVAPQLPSGPNPHERCVRSRPSDPGPLTDRAVMPLCSRRVMFWMMDSEKYSSGHHADVAEKQHKKSTHSATLSATSPVSKREGRSKKPASSRSGSLERHGSLQPSQPFMTDLSMPILPPPNTTTQLEEARRRLEDDSKTKASKVKYANGEPETNAVLGAVDPSCKTPSFKRGSSGGSKEKFSHPDSLTSKSGTRLSAPAKIAAEIPEDIAVVPRKSGKKSASSVTSVSSVTSPTGPDCGDFTIVGYFFCGDTYPIRTKLAGKSVTLRQFKSLISKKGNYKYFFKVASDEFGTGFLYQEVSDDSECLPLWDGKVVARVEAVEL